MKSVFKRLFLIIAVLGVFALSAGCEHNTPSDAGPKPFGINISVLDDPGDGSFLIEIQTKL